VLVSFVPRALAWAASVLQSSHLSVELVCVSSNLCSLARVSWTCFGKRSNSLGISITSLACSHKWSFEPDLR